MTSLTLTSMRRLATRTLASQRIGSLGVLSRNIATGCSSRQGKQQSFLQKRTHTFHTSSEMRKSAQPLVEDDNAPQYHISYEVDDLHLALFVPPSNGTTTNGERRILSPVRHVSSKDLEFGDDDIKLGEIESFADDTMSRFIEAVEKQYHTEDAEGSENKGKKVVGMGENDGGVWFAPYPSAIMPSIEPLLEWELIRDTIAVVKKHRHGIPFGVYTSGILPAELSGLAGELRQKVGLKHCMVTLGCSNPMEYEKKIYHPSCGIDSPQKAFQNVCSFIASAAESGYPVEAAILEGPDSGAASELAKALGAVEVHTFPHQK